MHCTADNRHYVDDGFCWDCDALSRGRVFCEVCQAYHDRVVCQGVAPISETVERDEDDAGGTTTMTFRLADVERYYGADWQTAHSDPAGLLTGFYESYSGPGQFYAHAPHMRIEGDAVIVTWHCGQDI